MRTFLLACAVSALAIIQVQSQGSAAWFGLPLPQGLSDPHRPVVDVRTATPPAARVPGGEERFGDLTGARIQRDLETIVGFSKRSHAAGDKVWGRVTGFPSAAATHAWVAEQFRAAGLQNVQVQPYEASDPMWWATSWEVRVVASPAYGAGSRDMVLESAVPTSGSQIAGGVITAPLVHVGAVTDAALPNVDVNGKVAVQHLKPAGGAYSERGPHDRAGARADQARRGRHPQRRSSRPATCTCATSAIAARRASTSARPTARSSKALMERAADTPRRRTVRVQLRLEASMRTGLTGQNAFGLIPSKVGSLSGESIIVNAHADGWYDAAGDNADGLAVLRGDGEAFLTAGEPSRSHAGVRRQRRPSQHRPERTVELRPSQSRARGKGGPRPEPGAHRAGPDRGRHVERRSRPNSR